MAQVNSYIKDIERHFLSVIGKGIMLSSRDYDVIYKWKSRGIPKEAVYRGITKAFTEGFRENKENDKRLKNLSQCASFVEEVIKNNLSPDATDASPESELEQKSNNILNNAVQRLNKIISSENRQEIRRHYIQARKAALTIEESDTAEIYRDIKEIEEALFENIFNELREEQRERIIEQANSKVSERSRFMTEQARRESILSFRDKILREEFQIKSILSYE